MSNPPVIEQRSIDPIPESERYGRLYSQFTLWMGVNLQITPIITGALPVIMGGDVFWSLIGLLLGNVFGAMVIALHAAQGPQLGLPQMISTRVQFGVYGAFIPIVLVCLMYIGFTATAAILSGQAIAQIAPVSQTTGILIFCALIATLALFGYRIIHILGRIATVLGMIAFIYLFIRITSMADVSVLLESRHFTWKSFLFALSLGVSWQVAFGPCVADYSRYLPSNISPLKTFLAVGLGAAIGAQAAMVLGVFAAALPGAAFAGREIAYIVGLGATGWIASLLYLSVAFGKVPVGTLNIYGNFLCCATIMSGFWGKVHFSQRLRTFIILLSVSMIITLALLGQNSFLPIFRSFIIFLLTVFTPWSAINLMDYYFVNKDRYNIPALYDPNSEYGRWNKPGISIYIISVLLQMPFIATSLYTGPMVQYVAGVDLSWLIGLVVPSVLYYCFGKRAYANSDQAALNLQEKGV